MTPIPYLFFDGACREAMTAYAEIFGGRVETMMTAAEMPPGEMPVPEDRKGWIMHAAVVFDAGMLMASDDLSGQSGPMAGCSVHMALPTAAEGAAVFGRLVEGGEVGMPYGATFWTPGFGTLRDRFGVRWMISTTEPVA